MASFEDEYVSWKEPATQKSFEDSSESSLPTAQTLLALDNTILNDFLEFEEAEGEFIHTGISQPHSSQTIKRKKIEPPEIVEKSKFKTISMLNDSFINEMSDNFCQYEIDSQRDTSFYGLPQKMKLLFKKYKGINELYGKFIFSIFDIFGIFFS